MYSDEVVPCTCLEWPGFSLNFILQCRLPALTFRFLGTGGYWVSFRIRAFVDCSSVSPVGAAKVSNLYIPIQSNKIHI